MKRVILATILTAASTGAIAAPAPQASTKELLDACRLYGAAVRTVIEWRDKGASLDSTIDGIQKVKFDEYGLDNEHMRSVLIADAAYAFRYRILVEAKAYSEKQQAACIDTIPGIKRM